MANIIKENVVINFGDKVWSSKENYDTFPGAFVHVLADATFNGNNGGIDMYSLFTKDGFNSKDNCGQAITVGDMKLHDENGNRTTVAENGADAYPGHLVINGGFYQACGSVVYVTNGLCEINDGIFFAQPDSNNLTKSEEEKAKYGKYRSFALNLWDRYGREGFAKIIVRGGSFIGFDPADNYAEGDHTNFVATGYKSVENGEYTYMIKDANKTENGTLTTVKVYTVVPTSDPREGIEGTMVIE